MVHGGAFLKTLQSVLASDHAAGRIGAGSLANTGAVNALDISAANRAGVTVVFIELPNTKIELLHPLGEGSPILGFLEKNPAGGIHHICYEVDDILAARDHLKASGARVLGSGEPKIGAHGKPVLFLHPKDFNGCLVELEQS